MTKKILIAEDDEDIVGLLRLYLEKDGYEVIYVDNGEDAFKIVKSKQISLAILDIMMPKMDGLRTTMKIREEKNIPIILISAKFWLKELCGVKFVGLSFTKLIGTIIWEKQLV